MIFIKSVFIHWIFKCSRIQHVFFHNIFWIQVFGFENALSALICKTDKHSLTPALHQLVVAVFRKERVFHSSEIELQHTSHWVQVTNLLCQGVISYIPRHRKLPSPALLMERRSLKEWTHIPFSNRSLSRLTSSWEPGTRKMPSWCRPCQREGASMY